jgi:hypothetical protein
MTELFNSSWIEKKFFIEINKTDEHNGYVGRGKPKPQLYLGEFTAK